MRHLRVYFPVRPATIAVTLVALLLAVVTGPLVWRRDQRPVVATKRAQERAPTHSGEQPAGTGAEAFALGGRRAVEVDGKPLIVDGYAAFPSLGDLDGDGRSDLLLGDPYGFLKVYRNIGKPGRLRLAASAPFGNFCDDERIPTG